MSGGTIVYNRIMLLLLIKVRSALNQGLLQHLILIIQLGASLAGVSDVYSLAVKTFTATGDIIGLFNFFDLTQ
jgi:hypothetical protein